MELKKGQKIIDFIKSKYGKFDDETMKKFFLQDFFVSSLSKKISEQDYLLLKNEIDNLLQAQGLEYKDIEYLGVGQQYSTIGIGDAVLKLGGSNTRYFENPYVLNLVYYKSVNQDIGIYVSQKARTEDITEEQAQEMYNMIRDAGGVWLDVKEDNLGYIDKKKDFHKIYGHQDTTDKLDIEFEEYNGNLYIIDYQDVVFITPQIKQKILNYEEVNINGINPSVLRDEQDLDSIYFEGYIKNSKTLLRYEANYQKQKGNLQNEKKCYKQLKELQRKTIQHEYVTEQMWVHNREYRKIGKKYSAKEIGIQVMQKTSLSSLKQTVNTVKEKMRLRHKDRRNNELSDYEIDEIVQNGGFIINDDPYNTSNANRLDDDPYNTR